jgi:hypothetical protein
LLLAIKGHFRLWKTLKTLFRASKRPRKSGTQKLGKKTTKLENYQNEPVGIGGRPLKYIWIIFPFQILLYLDLHVCIEFDLLVVHCAEALDYIAQGYIVAPCYCIVAMQCCMRVVPS